jgi:hypothetical protein
MNTNETGPVVETPEAIRRLELEHQRLLLEMQRDNQRLLVEREAHARAEAKAEQQAADEAAEAADAAMAAAEARAYKREQAIGSRQMRALVTCLEALEGIAEGSEAGDAVKIDDARDHVLRALRAHFYARPETLADRLLPALEEHMPAFTMALAGLVAARSAPPPAPSMCACEARRAGMVGLGPMGPAYPGSYSSHPAPWTSSVTYTTSPAVPVGEVNAAEPTVPSSIRAYWEQIVGALDMDQVSEIADLAHAEWERRHESLETLEREAAVRQPRSS